MMTRTTTATVYCVIPVHNRLEVTRRCLDYLSAQDYAALQIVVVDDASTDGTGEYLAQCGLPNLSVLNGTGDLWWGGAMHLGVAHVIENASKNDYLLMLNDDVRVNADYVSILVKEAIDNEDSVIGSAQREDETGGYLSCGCQIDYWGMRILPIEGKLSSGKVDALPGRGVLFPMPAVNAAGNINCRTFPHYLGDLEYSARINQLGWRIVVSQKADIFTSAENSDQAVRQQGFRKEYFSFRSKNNLPHRLWFFSLRGPIWLRLWAIPRYFLFGGWRLMSRLLA